MEMNHLKYFYEVAKNKSFTKAAASMKVSQPSISKTISNLEYVHDIKLFDRSKKSTNLTSIGELIYKRCEVIFQEIKNIENLIQSHKEDCIGDLSLGASDNICNYLLPEIIGKFLNMHQKVNIKLFSGASSEIKKEIINDNIEFGVFYTPTREREHKATKITSVEFFLVCKNNHPLTKVKKFDPKQLQKYKYIGSRSGDYHRQYPALKLLHEQINIDPKMFIETNNQETQKRIAINGFGYTVIPEHMITEDIKKNNLAIIKTPKKLFSDVYWVHKKNKTLSKPAIMFKDYMLESMSTFG